MNRRGLKSDSWLTKEGEENTQKENSKKGEGQEQGMSSFTDDIPL
jgi:hypothetical protein